MWSYIGTDNNFQSRIPIALETGLHQIKKLLHKGKKELPESRDNPRMHQNNPTNK
jgi:hypothetical protein